MYVQTKRVDFNSLTSVIFHSFPFCATYFINHPVYTHNLRLESDNENSFGHKCIIIDDDDWEK